MRPNADDAPHFHDDDAQLHQFDELLRRAGEPLRTRNIPTERLTATLRQIAAQPRLTPAHIPLQEEFTLMSASLPPEAPKQSGMRWRVLLPAALVFLIIVGSFVIFPRLARSPTISAFATPTVTRPKLPAGTLATFTTGQYAPVTLTTGGDGNIWFTAYQGAFSTKQFPPASPLVIGKMQRDGSYQVFPVPTTQLAPNETRDSLPQGTAGANGYTWFPLLVIAHNGSTERREREEMAKVAPDGQITLYPIPSSPKGDVFIWSMVLGSDGNIWFTANAPGNPATSNIGKITANGTVTWLNNPQVTAVGYITAGPDGNLWFANGLEIGRLTTKGVVTFYSLGGVLSVSGPLSFDHSGHLWFAATQYSTDQSYEAIVRFNSDTHAITVVDVEHHPNYVFEVFGGPDGSIWQVNNAEYAPDFLLRRVAADGTLTSIALPKTDWLYYWVIDGRDGHLWFIDFRQSGTDGYASYLARLTPSA